MSANDDDRMARTFLRQREYYPDTNGMYWGYSAKWGCYCYQTPREMLAVYLPEQYPFVYGDSPAPAGGRDERESAA